MTHQRINHETAFVLHSYAWSESSLILELFTRHYGRIALVAKGAKRPSSQFRPILLPLQLLSINYSRGDEAQTEVGTLKGAEWQGGQTMPVGEALLSGYYINELTMKLLARDDPHEKLFDAYRAVVGWLRDALLDAGLRAFELVLLREIGLLPALNMTSLSHAALEADVLYTLAPEVGLREVSDASTQNALPASVWQALHAALASSAAIVGLREVVSTLSSADRQALKLQLRSLLNFSVGGRGLRTRTLLRELQALS